MLKKSELINAAEHIKKQQFRYDEKLVMSGVVPANTAGTSFRVHVSTLGSFLLKHITGTFTTLNKPENTDIVDTGSNFLTCQLLDGYGNKPLFSDFIPMDLFLSPGRRKSVLAVNALHTAAGYDRAADSSTLFYPQEFQYIFNENTDIVLNVTNTSNADNSFDICFHGIRFVSNNNIYAPVKR